VVYAYPLVRRESSKVARSSNKVAKLAEADNLTAICEPVV
jgi:hypothetical protein